eukprot:15365003-Ditylum_brightwellii.AAC.1
MVDSEKEKIAVFHDKKYQGGKTLPFLDHDFTCYHTTELYQWEVDIQLLAKGTMQLNLASGIGGKVKALLRRLKVENFPKSVKEVKDLLDYSHYANLLKEQNQYLANYNDFHIGGIRDKRLSKKFNGNTLREHLDLQGVIEDITQTVFTDSKGIWQVKTTKKQVVEAMRHVTEALDRYKDDFPDNKKGGTLHFPSLES